LKVDTSAWIVTILVTMVKRLAVHDDDELLVLAHSPRLRTILEASRRQIHEGEGISHRISGRSWWRRSPSRDGVRAREKPQGEIR
jgi:hypothetical protein